MLARMQERMNANMKTMQEKADADREQMLAKMNANTKAMREDIKSGEVEMRSIVGHIEEKMNAWMANMNDGRKERTACHEATEADTEKTEHNPVMMQSIGEHQEVPKEEAAVMPVGGLRKRRRDRNLAAGRRQKPKRRIQASCESRRRLTVTGRKMTRHARVAWRRKSDVRKIRTQENCGPRKELAAGRKMTHCAKVARRKGSIVRNKWTRAKAERGIQRVWTLREKVRTRHEGRE
jgi:hypothetical protein